MPAPLCFQEQPTLLGKARRPQALGSQSTKNTICVRLHLASPPPSRFSRGGVSLAQLGAPEAGTQASVTLDSLRCMTQTCQESWQIL